MTDEELLLIDLCARLPYGVKVAIGDTIVKLKSITKWKRGIWYAHVFSEDIGGGAVEGVKPCLYPMSSMTEEQKEELKELCNCDDVDKDGITYNEEGTAEVCWTKVSFKGCSEVVDWLNKHHFDYRGLIEKGLALDATRFDINIYGNN